MIHWQAAGSVSALIVMTAFAGCAKPSAPTATTAPAGTPAETPPASVTAAGETVATNGTTTPPEAVAVADAGSEQTAAAGEAQPAAAFYSIAVYDENQDPTADMASTIERATAANKRILIQVGGEWCVWCHRISDYMETNEKVRKLIDEHFIVMKVTYPAAKVDSFLEQYPRVEAYPHLFVLEPDGTFLHSQGTSELELEKGYNEEVFCQFLNDWMKK